MRACAQGVANYLKRANLSSRGLVIGYDYRFASEDFAAASAEVIADFRGVHQQSEFTAGREAVLELLRRRPCSVEDIADGLGMHRNEVVKYVEELSSKGKIAARPQNQRLYYKALT